MKKRPADQKPNPIKPSLPTLALVALVGVAIASPTAAATGNLPSEAAGALAILVPVAVLMVSLVIAVWKQTARNALPSPEQWARAQASASTSPDANKR
ncbi:MAG: hypothetical protein KDJ19_05200 [Hyphomicrobiaceae bacterium]|nr:hypothetical protein [Hyphomicrobiaceae bacterium]MCC0023238.1 hypothetical protein [Hyphomicrobiaceae bacterium]